MARKTTRKKPTKTTAIDDSQFNKPNVHGRIVSNYYANQWIDRIYSSGFGDSMKHYLINADGTEYQGKITETTRRQKTHTGHTFRQTLYKTADGRWFDNGGMPMSDPGEIPEETDDQPL